MPADSAGSTPLAPADDHHRLGSPAEPSTPPVEPADNRTLGQDQPQVPFAGDQAPVQALAPGTAYPAFRDRPGVPDRCLDRVDVYLDNTTFAQLVADGWIGSSGTGTGLIKEQIEASRAGQREPILAFASGDAPKARRIRERLRG